MTKVTDIPTSANLSRYSKSSDFSNDTKAACSEVAFLTESRYFTRKCGKFVRGWKLEILKINYLLRVLPKEENI